MLHIFSPTVTFFTSFICIILLTPLSIRIGLVDVPNDRKHHKGNVPLIGGLAMFLGFLAGLLTLPFSLEHYRSFIAGSALLVFTGLLDDFSELSPKSRFLAQVVAILLMILWGHVQINHLGNIVFYKDISLGQGGVLVTVIAGLGIINAINMVDGVDGLAGTLALVELLLLLYLAVEIGQFLSANILLLMIASVASFLWFNFRFPGRLRVQVFMGDAGSMLIGFVLLWFLIELSQARTHAITPVTMLWIMALPLFDTASVILYRLGKRRSAFSSDRQHGHHLLLALQFSSLQVSVILGCLNLVLGIVGLLAYHYRLSESVMFLSFLITFIIYFLFVSYLRAWFYKKNRNSTRFCSFFD